MITLVDCDGVLGRFTQTVLDAYNADHGTSFVEADVHQWSIPDALGIPADELYAHVKEGFCSTIQVVPGAAEALARMRAVSKVVCVTAGWNRVPTWDYERRVWLRDKLGFDFADVIFAEGEAKFMVDGDIFFDDRPDNVESWQAKRFDRVGVLVRQPWNAGVVWPNYVNSVEEMAKVTEALAALTGDEA